MLLETAPLETVEVQTEYLDYFSRNIQSIGSSLIYVVSGIDKIWKRSFKLDSNWKTTYLWSVTDGHISLTTLVGDGTVENSWGAK